MWIYKTDDMICKQYYHLTRNKKSFLIHFPFSHISPCPHLPKMSKDFVNVLPSFFSSSSPPANPTAICHLPLLTLTCLQMSFASSENLSEYSSWSSRTRLSTSSRLTRSLRLRKGDWPCIISKIRQPSPHQSGLTV